MSPSKDHLERRNQLDKISKRENGLEQLQEMIARDRNPPRNLCHCGEVPNEVKWPELSGAAPYCQMLRDRVM